jgi:hypothetical protein
MQHNSTLNKIMHREKTREEYEQERLVQPGIAFPSAGDQEHLLILRLEITGALFTNDFNKAKTTVKNGLKRLCTLFENIHNGKKKIDELCPKKNSPDEDRLNPKFKKDV